MYFIAQVYFIPHGGKGTDTMIESFPLVVFSLSTILHNIPFSLLMGENAVDRRRGPPGAFGLAETATRNPLRNCRGKRAAERAGAGPGAGELRIDPHVEKRKNPQSRRRRQSTALPSTSGRKGTAGDSGRPPAAGHGSCRRPAGQHANQTVGRGNIRSAS